MSQIDEALNSAETRRPFAARYEHRGTGIALAGLGGLFLLAGLGGEPVSLVLALALIAGSVYLLRGVGESPATAQRRAAAAERREQAVQAATDALAAAEGGGAKLVAYRNLESVLAREYPADAAARFDAALDSIGFDRGDLDSPRFGYVAAVSGGSVEVFRDWVVFGQEAHDVDASTRCQVFVDGAVQVSSHVEEDRNGRKRVVNQQHDMRRATLQFTSASWSMSVAIQPDAVDEARLLAARLVGHVESLAPAAASTADIQELVRTILDNTGQPPAEKLQQLSNLRYERLLTDDEFKLAKDKILGL
ncbi:hypothetical protein [Demequina pelophila]|uniref:hypothetical protein n=1 Tax=Demequina pelophila TaxID=1638984 RepID=UPI0007829501|nr:hypothetical protein [Demequina pelophila]